MGYGKHAIFLDQPELHSVCRIFNTGAAIRNHKPFDNRTF